MIEGIVITPLRQIPDERGTVLHMLRATDPVFSGFGEVYFSTVKHGAVKAWKRHHRMVLNVVCLHGAIRFVCYDDRPQSPTRGAVQEIHLSADPAHYALATIPPGVWTGFTGVAFGESILCNCASIPHDPTESDRCAVDDPAIPYQWNGLTPIDTRPLIRLSRSSVSDDDVSNVAETTRRGFLGMGKEVDAFERELSAYIGGENRHVICVNTGTSALHLALQACGVGPGDEVLVPTLTYIASFQAISATGATPVACDVRESDGLLDLTDAARRITPRTRAVMPVHYASNPALLVEVYEFAQRHGLRVIEDAAHAFGCRWNGQRIGATGDLVCFSFDGIKNITCGEGGAVITGDPDAAERIRNARLLGVIKDTEKRYTGQRSWDFDVTEQGWRYHMSNPNAALGRSQLHALTTRFAPRRIELGVNYHELLGDIPNLRMLPIEYGDIIPHIFPIFVPAEKRDTLRETLRAANIETGIHYKPNHLLSLYGGGSASLPVAEKLYSQMLSIPLHAELTAAEQQSVVETIKTALS